MTSSDALHLVCPHCHGTNRVRASDMAHAPDCGHCHRPLLTGAPTEVDGAALHKHITRSHVPVLVDFGRRGVARAARWPRPLPRRRSCWSRRFHCSN